MVRHTRRAVVSGVCVALAAALSGCASTSAPEPATAPPTESSPAATLVDQKCSMCHTTERVYGADYDAAKWASTIERMEQNGLVISPDEKQAIIDFLVEQGAAQ